MTVYTDVALISSLYAKMEENITNFRSTNDRFLTLSEKLMIGHLSNNSFSSVVPGRDYILLKPDHVALQDVTGQMVLLQFMQSGLEEVSISTTVHCDHLIQAQVSATEDIKKSLFENNEVYKFLESACCKFGIGFWKPGAGIIHQVLLEN